MIVIIVIIEDVNLHVKEKEFLAIIRPNGGGKSKKESGGAVHSEPQERMHAGHPRATSQRVVPPGAYVVRRLVQSKSPSLSAGWQDAA